VQVCCDVMLVTLSTHCFLRLLTSPCECYIFHWPTALTLFAGNDHHQHSVCILLPHAFLYKILSLVFRRSSVVKYIIVIISQPLVHSFSVGDSPWPLHWNMKKKYFYIAKFRFVGVIEISTCDKRRLNNRKTLCKHSWTNNWNPTKS